MCWRPISDYWLWNIETENTLHWWFFSIIHFSAWICIYGGSVILDLPDLIGVKQVDFEHWPLFKFCSVVVIDIVFSIVDLLLLSEHTWGNWHQIGWTPQTLFTQAAPKFCGLLLHTLDHTSHEVKQNTQKSVSPFKSLHNFRTSFCLFSLDRALMAAVLTVYMVTAWEPTVDDKRYHQRQMLQKQQEIAYINRRKKMNSGSRNFRG